MVRALFIETTWEHFPKGQYPRNKRLYDQLKKEYDAVDRIAIPAPKGMIYRFFGLMKLWGKLIPKLKYRYDMVCTGYNNLFFEDLVIRLFSRSQLYVTDMLYSKWYTFVKDYKHKLSPASRWMMRTADNLKIRMGDFIIVDTKAHHKMLEKYFPRLKYKHTILEYVHTDYKLFDPKIHQDTNHIVFKNRVFFHGGYIPLQGTPIITQAVSELEGVSGVMIGRGHDFKKAYSKYNLKNDNILFVDEVKYTNLPGNIHESEVCLGGPFGTSEKAKAVITNKTFEYLAMNKKTIVGDTPANKELLDIFPEKKHLIYFCKTNSVKDLKNTIIKALKDKPF